MTWKQRAGEGKLRPYIFGVSRVKCRGEACPRPVASRSPGSLTDPRPSHMCLTLLVAMTRANTLGNMINSSSFLFLHPAKIVRLKDVFSFSTPVYLKSEDVVSQV